MLSYEKWGGSLDFSSDGQSARCSYSELEGNAGDVLVLRLAELVFEGGEELRVDFKDEALDILCDRLQLLFCILGRLHHLLVPNFGLLDAFCGEDQCSCGQFTPSVL